LRGSVSDYLAAAVSNDDDELETRTLIGEHLHDPPLEPERPDLRPTPISIRERITLRGLHSSGGIGEVWRAYDEVIGREIALKRLQPDQRTTAAHRARFEREAKLTGQLEHPGIVPVYDYSSGDDGSHCFYTMRFVRGRTLRTAIHEFHEQRREGRPLLGAAFMQLISQFLSLCNTMAFAHSRAVIHRDLKGDNVIVGDFGEVLILDWGLAKHLGEVEPERVADGRESDSVLETRQGEQLGTPAYMAPEQARGDIDLLDPRTDVYGLAAILYEILTGRPPFTGTIAEVFYAVIERPPTPPHELVVDVPPELEQICLRGLAKAMDERWQSAAELGRAVEAWQSALAERKRVEQERERFFDLSLDLLAIVDRHANFTQVNAAWQRVLGLSPSVGESLFATLHEQDVARAQAKLDALWAGAEAVGFELRMHGQAGERWIDWSVRSLPDDVGAYLVGRDITERKQAAQEVEGLIESAPDAMCVIDETGVIVRVNAQLERMYGYPRERMLGERVEILVPAEARGRHVGHVARYVASPSSRPMGSGLRLVGERADGTLFPVEVSLSPVQTETKLLVACTLRDVGERRRHERTMMAMLEAAPDAMIAIDRQHVIRLLNRQTERLFGYAKDELLGQPLEQLIPERFHAVHGGHMQRYMDDPSPRTMGVGRVLVARRKDGSEFPVEVSLSPVETDDGLLIASAIRPARGG
jgi:PAS domain S-box-containing protein